jgi:hypothetical protein
MGVSLGCYDLRVPIERCQEQAALATAVVGAINKVDAAKRGLEPRVSGRPIGTASARA